MESMKRMDHYRALGVIAGATQKEIEVSFWRLQEKRRRRQVNEQTYHRAEEAYLALSDPGRRADHDRQLGLREHPAWRRRSKRAARVHFRRGMDLMARGHYRRALESVRRALELDPEEAAHRSYFGLLLALTGGCLHTAEHHGRSAMEQAPGMAGFTGNLARIYELAGLRERALRLRCGWRRLLF